MNIALINQWYLPEGGFGGIAKYNYYMANAYRKLGHNVFVISSLTGEAEKYIFKDGIHIYRIKQFVFPWFFNKVAPLTRFLRFLRDLIYSFSVRSKLIELNKNFKIDIVEYAEINSEGFVHSIFGPKRIPFIVRCHTPYFILKDYYLKQERVFDNPFIYWMEKTLIKKAPYITTPSMHLANIISSKLGVENNKISVVSNAIDVNKFFPKPPLIEKKDEIKLLYVGRIERGKGVFVLAEAFVELIKVYGNRLKCIFIGPDRSIPSGKSTRDLLFDFFSRKGILENVEFKREVSEKELISFYNERDIFINPSLIYESFSYTCLEAMACGKPVIASRIGGIPEVVDDGITGFLFEPGNVDELTQKLMILIEDKGKMEIMGRKGREKVEKCFNVLNVAKDNLKIYQKLYTP